MAPLSIWHQELAQRLHLLTGSALQSQKEQLFGGEVEIPRGAITEVSGRLGGGKTEWLATWLAHSTFTGAVAWIEERTTVHPPALAMAGVALDRVVFIEAGQELLWCVHQVTRSQAFDMAVVGRPVGRVWDERVWRRMQLACEASRMALVVLGEEPTLSVGWSIALQLFVERTREDVLSVRRLRSRGGSATTINPETNSKGEDAWKTQIRSVG